MKKKEVKSMLQIVLIPILLSLVGISASYYLSKVQIDIMKHQAESELKINILGLFAEKIVGTPSEQELALILLRVLDSDLHQKLAAAIVESSDKSQKIIGLAKVEENLATQRLDNEKKEKEGKSLLNIGSPSDILPTPIADICSNFDKFTKKIWKETYLKPLEQGKWNIIVKTLSKNSTQDSINESVTYYNKKFNNHYFISSSTGDGSNLRPVILIASGIQNEDQARKIARYATNCGIATEAYPYREKNTLSP